jgi:hypothetical protein
MPIQVEYRPNALLTGFAAYKGGRAEGKRQNAQMQLQQSMQTQRIAAGVLQQTMGNMFQMASQGRQFNQQREMANLAYQNTLGAMDQRAQLDWWTGVSNATGLHPQVIESQASELGITPVEHASNLASQRVEQVRQMQMAKLGVEEVPYTQTPEGGQELMQIDQAEDTLTSDPTNTPEFIELGRVHLAQSRQQVMSKRVMRPMQQKFTYQTPKGPISLGLNEGMVDPDLGSWTPNGQGHDYRAPGKRENDIHPIYAQADQQRQQYLAAGMSEDDAWRKAFERRLSNGTVLYLDTDGKYKAGKDNLEIMGQKARSAERAQYSKDENAAWKQGYDGYIKSLGDETSFSVDAANAAAEAAVESFRNIRRTQGFGPSSWAYEPSPYPTSQPAAGEPAGDEEWGPVETRPNGRKIQRHKQDPNRVRLLN